MEIKYRRVLVREITEYELEVPADFPAEEVLAVDLADHDPFGEIQVRPVKHHVEVVGIPNSERTVLLPRRGDREDVICS